MTDDKKYTEVISVKQKKAIIVLCIIVLVCIGVASLGFVIFLRKQDDKYVKNANTDDISRYDWMEMLCEQSGLKEYQNGVPYFEDIDVGNEYFSYIQSAVEWNVLEQDKTFEGDSYASGRFVVLTAMKTLGEEKMKLYFDTEKDITDSDYLQAALEHNLIDQERLSMGMSRETAKIILDYFSKLFYTEFWVDNYEKAEYQDGVVEIAPENILYQKRDISEITCSEEVCDDISEGTIVVFQQDKTGLKTAKRVDKVDEKGVFTLTDDVELSDVLRSLTVSDITEISAKDIINYYDTQEEYAPDNMKYEKDNVETFMPVWAKSHKGFKIAASVKEDKEDRKNKLDVIIVDYETGKNVPLLSNQEVSWKNEYYAELDVDQINIAAQIKIDGKEVDEKIETKDLLHIEYVDVALDIQSTFSGSIKQERSTDKSEKYKLLDTTIPLVNGLAGVDVQIYIVISAEGTISLEAELPVNLGVRYERKKGVRNYSPKLSWKQPTLSIDCKADLMLRFEPIILVLEEKVIDAEADIGMTVEAERILRPDSMICTELSESYPVIKISVCGDEEIETLLNTLVKYLPFIEIDVPKEWEVISAEKAPIKQKYHLEELTNGYIQIVDECTYQEKNVSEKIPNSEMENRPGDVSVNTYITEYGDNKFAFDYPDSWGIEVDKSENLSSIFKENVTLKNNQDVMVQYREQVDDSLLGGQGHAVSVNIEVTEVADSAIEGFMVGKVQIISGMDMLTGEEYAIEDGAVSYAVVPESYAGIHESVGIYLDDELSFQYHLSRYIFRADSADGQFTEEEEKEIIGILSSFRTE